MSEIQRKVYKGVLMRDIDTVNGASVGRTAILNIVMQLRKCCNHPYLFPNTEDRNLDPMGEHLVENCGKVRCSVCGGRGVGETGCPDEKGYVVPKTVRCGTPCNPGVLLASAVALILRNDIRGGGT